MIEIIKVVDDRTGKPVCNPDTCPTMSASGHTYTWLDNNKKPIKIPAIQYINLVQKWIVGKINDPNIFPTDTTAISIGASTYASGSMTPTSTPQPLGPTSSNASMSQLAGREWLGKSANKDYADRVRIIYGGSMKPENAQGLMEQADVDGGLIGGAALKADSFLALCKTAAAWYEKEKKAGRP